MSRTCFLWAAGIAGLMIAAPATTAPRRPAPRTAAPKRTAKPAPAPKAPALPAELRGAVSVDVAPASVQLHGSRAVQHLIVTATLKDGSTWDVTEHAVFVLANPKLARVQGGLITPLADGTTTVIARLGALKSPASQVVITEAGSPPQVEFVNDVMPILAKTGCNSTACHGSPAGKGGLKLSLFGYEPELDHPALVTDAGGKRVDLKNPEKSLLLQKATGAVTHGGGARFKTGSREYQTMLAWLKDGANGIGEFEARVKSILVVPDEPWMPKPGSKQRLAVTAVLSDGSTRDVTDKALFTSNDDSIAEVDEAGRVTARQPGETAVMVRYMGQVAVSRVAVLPPWPAPAIAARPANYIDEKVLAKVQRLRMAPAELCTDEEFIRRATLDVCGIIPTADEVRQFLSDPRRDKRRILIDRLLEREEFVDLWTVRWNDILRNNPRVTRRGTGDYADWIREQIKSNRPYDEFVRDLLTATGRNVDEELTLAALPPQLRDRPNAQRQLDQLNRSAPNAAANYFVVSRDPLDATSATSQVFLGVRIECARCHNHPFEKWTQSDYFGLAAFLAGIQARGNAQTATVVNFNPYAPKLRHPKTNEPVDPKTLDNTEVTVDRGTDRREVLARWITSPQNPWFARAIANRVWAHYMGRGIVEPVDDFRVTNPPSNPELLDALARDLVEAKFDLKHLHRTILNSRTYQQSSRAGQFNRHDTQNFARFYPKRLMAEQLYDSISQATGLFIGDPLVAPRPGRPGRPGRPFQRPMPPIFQGGGRYGIRQADIKRVMQSPVLVPGIGQGRVAGGLGEFLDTFGKPRREVVCECERSTDGNMGQALALINGEEVNQKIGAETGRVRRTLASGKPEPEIVTEFYLAALSRRPTPTELNEAVALLRSGRSREEGAEDLMWSLLNSREFLFNH